MENYNYTNYEQITSKVDQSCFDHIFDYSQYSC